MSRRREEELEAMREDGLSAEIRREFQASAQATRQWDRAHPLDVEAALAWIEERPLYGRSVVVTRARAQASGLAARLGALGAEVVETPAIRMLHDDASRPAGRG